jgi:hypothetical protein
METLIDIGADAFVIGEQKFGLRLPGEFNREPVFHVKIEYNLLMLLNDNYGINHSLQRRLFCDYYVS